MKKYGMIVLAALFMLLIASNDVHAQKWNQEDVPSDKVWTIKFNTPMDFSSANKNIEVRGENESELPPELIFENNDKHIVVFPPSNGYKEGEEYELIVHKGIKSKAGVKSETSYQMTFTIEETTLTVTETTRLIDERLESFTDIFYGDLQGITYDHQKDFSRIRGDLRGIATEGFVQSTESVYKDICLGCGAWFMTFNLNWDAHTEVIAQSPDRIDIETIHLGDEFYPDEQITVTLVKEDGVWKFEGIAAVPLS